MKKKIFVILILFTSFYFLYEKLDRTIVIENIVKPNNSVEDILKNMHLTFEDNFDTLSLYTDLKGNTTCEKGGKGRWQTVLHFCSRTIWSNNEAELYIDPSFLTYWKKKKPEANIKTKTPFEISNGVLSIEAAPVEKGIQDIVGSWVQYTSGIITTEFSFSQMYGYFEIRAKFPKGDGLWPAFWLLPADETWPPEIDIVEFFGGENEENQGGLTMIHNASHIENPKLSKYCGTWHDMKVDITNDFHTYGVNWQPDGITYYFDGVPYTKCPPNPLSNKPFYLLANLAVGGTGSWPGTPDSTNIWPAYVYIDYIRAYQNN